MIKRRAVLAIASVAVLSVCGCAAKHPSSTSPVTDIPVTTVIDPKVALAAAPVTANPVTFTDITTASGVHWTYQTGASGKHRMMEDLGGGVALFDYNNDGLLDIYAPQAGPLPAAPPDERNFSHQSVLYRNNGDGTFTDVTDAAGLGGDHHYGQGVSIADYDNDGWPDIYVSAYEGNTLFHNNGNGTFTDVTAKAGVVDTRGLAPAEPPWPLSSAWGDYDNDGRLDLFVCHYVRWSPAIDKPCRGREGDSSYCRPQVYEPSHCALYHNNGDGTFTDVTHKSGIDQFQGKSMSAIWFDADGDGWLDIFVSNDTTPNFLLHNNHNGTFTDRGVTMGVAYGDQGQAMSGMGLGMADYDNDGLPDLFAVNFSGQPKSVFHNLGQGVFESTTYKTNIASTDLQFLGFGLECFDYDLDGHMDFVIGNGHVLDKMDAATAGSSYAQSQQLFHNQGDGTFVTDLRSLGDLVIPRVTRGLAVGDLDNDGDQDVVMVSQTGPLQLFRNDGGNSANWITLRLEGVTCNRDAIGAKVVLSAGGRKLTQWVHGGSSYCSHSDYRMTFGLADTTVIDSIEVTWPGGQAQKFGALPAKHFYWLREGGAAKPDPRVHI